MSQTLATQGQTLAAQYGISQSLAASIASLAARMGIDPTWLANVIRFESRFNPRAKNPHSGATGLIQFMPDTARELGTNTTSLYMMSAERQMQYVEQYFNLRRIPKPLRSQLDVFMAVFYPAAVGKGRDYRFPASIAAPNHGIRTAGDYYDMAMRSGTGGSVQTNFFAPQIEKGKKRLLRMTVFGLVSVGIYFGLRHAQRTGRPLKLQPLVQRLPRL